MLSTSGAFIIGLFFFVSIFDIFIVKANENSNDNKNLDEKFGDSLSIQNKNTDTSQGENLLPTLQDKNSKDHSTLKFLFCVSCGYKQAFMQFSDLANEKYPDILIDGDNFAPALWKTYLAQAIGIVKSVLLIIIMTGTNPFETLGFGYPQLLQRAHNNKLSFGMLLYLLANMIESCLLSTGAFEIFLNGEQIWSKIETGRVPSPEEFIQLIDAKLVNKTVY
ncbi:unnamed protein product [Caenorhabditis brenneri]